MSDCINQEIRDVGFGPKIRGFEKLWRGADAHHPEFYSGLILSMLMVPSG